jgi:hypothetical protein
MVKEDNGTEARNLPKFRRNDLKNSSQYWKI